MTYLVKRFQAAVSALVVEGSVKDRLAAAYSEHLDDLEISELPRDLQAKFEDLHSALHAVTPIGKELCVRATVRKMSRLQAGAHARTIFTLYERLVSRSDRAAPLKAVNGTRKESPPLASRRA